MAVSKAVLAVAALAAVGAGVAAWIIWPTEEKDLVRMLGRARSDGFDLAMLDCRSQETVDDVLRCVASDLYPEAAWPPPDNASRWQKETWRLLERRVRDYLGLPPRPQIATLKV